MPYEPVSIYQIIVCLFIIIIGAISCFSLCRFFPVTRARALLLYFWHTLFCFVYAWTVVRDGGDAIAYYLLSLESDLQFSLGTAAVRYLVSFFSSDLGLSFWACSLIFHYIGFIGLLAFDASLISVTWYKSKYVRMLATFVVFLPSVSFWSSGLGKDALSFLSVGLALWAALSMARRWPILVVSFLLMLIVRPHMAGIMVLALACSFIVQSRISLVQRVIFGAFAILAAAFLVTLGMTYAGVSADAGAAEVIQFIESRQAYNQTGGGAVDISSMSLPAQLFTYLFRPTLFEVRNLFSLAAAIDNLILLLLFIVGGYAVLRKPLPQRLFSHNRMFLWVYSGVTWLILAMTTANLGIALRQKWMFVTMLIFLLISVVGRDRHAPKGDGIAHGMRASR